MRGMFALQEPNVKRSLAVENPILNDPFQEPREHWLYKEGQPGKEQGRRPAGYYMRPTTTDTIRAAEDVWPCNTRVATAPGTTTSGCPRMDRLRAKAIGMARMAKEYE